MQIYLWISRNCDPFFIFEIFKVEDVTQIDRYISEEEIFEQVEESSYLKALYGIVNQIRYQRQPFTEIRVLFEGEMESEVIIQSLCVMDEAANPRMKMDFGKYMAKV